MSDPAIEEVRADVVEFERTLDAARAEKYGRYRNGAEVLRMLEKSPPATWKLSDLLEAYLAAGYPQERLRGVMDRAMDLKLQVYYILEVDLGMYNSLYQDLINADPSRSNSAMLKLRRMSFDQTLIGKSRILWERFMSLVYYLETGKNLARTSKRSSKKAFFRWVRASPRWRYLEPYEPFLEQFDNQYRTPEYHQASFLRAELLGHREHDWNALLVPLNRATNQLWDAVLAIVSGHPPSVFTDLHMPAGGKHGIDPRFLEPWG